MTLGELKKSLAKLPPDMNDMQMVIIYAKNGEMKMELVAFTGYIPAPGFECIAIGSVSEIKRRVDAGEMDPPEGYDRFQ